MTKTYAQLREEGETKRRESNLANLVSARLALVEEKDRLLTQINDIDEMIVKIDDLGETETPTMDEVKKLYNDAMKLR
jgi:hypothetical protein